MRLIEPVLVGASLLCATTIAAPAWAQQEDEQLWLQTNVHVPLDSNTRVTLEQIARFSDRLDGLYTTEYGALFGQKVTKGLEFGFGYRHVAFHNGNRNADENRFRQQLVGNYGRFSFRLRLDERLHPDGNEIGFRLRPLLRYNQPLNKKGLALFVSHESFYLPNATSWGQKRGYERMRNLVGFVIPINAKASADVAYLNQYRPARDGARAQMDHALSMQLTINLGAKRKRDVHPGD